MKKLCKIIQLLSCVYFLSCDSYLDIVPDGVATLENAFTMRTTAERYLFTCYSHLPEHGTPGYNPALLSGDEIWVPETITSNAKLIAQGRQKVVDPYMDSWVGINGGASMFLAIRDCNTFLANIDQVPDMEEFEKIRWKAEVTFLKAYYHYYLVRMYGAIPLMKTNLPISAGVEEVQVYRDPFDDCINYVVELLDTAAAWLPERIENEVSELGRASKAMALSLKAEVLIMAASPLFNGNPDFSGLKSTNGTELFPATADPGKWQRALTACKAAIDLCESLGYELYYYNPQFSQYDLSDTTLTQMSLRNSVCDPWNKELIWGDVNSRADAIQSACTPRGLDPDFLTNSVTTGHYGVPMKIAELFYSENGVPIVEDKTWNYANRHRTRVVDHEHRFVLKEGYVTAELNFNREPRYYASLGFDGSIWYGMGVYDDQSPDLLFVSSRKGGPASMIQNTQYSVSGFWPKKLVHFQNTIAQSAYTRQLYPWPLIRLASLYLYYAEALNEVSGPSDQVYFYLDAVRRRAGLPAVEEAWTNYSSNPTKYTHQNGLREIIQREREVEFLFEGQRFWDLKRWKRATVELSKPITGWDLLQENPEFYYREVVIFNQRFNTRDYLWPINESELLKNKNLVQNPGW